jgi:hypothetical protein
MPENPAPSALSTSNRGCGQKTEIHVDSASVVIEAGPAGSQESAKSTFIAARHCLDE